MNLIILPAHKIWSRGSSVAGTADATYLASYLCDGVSSQPVKGTGVTHAYVCTFPAAGTVNFVAMINASNVNVNPVLSAGVSTTLIANPLMSDGLRLNPYKWITPVAAVTAITFTITGNAVIPTVGEFIAGEAYEFERHIRKGSRTGFYAKNSPRSDDYDFQPALDKNAGGRTREFEITCTSTGIALLEQMYRAQRGDSLPFAIVPTPDINDCWWVRLTSFVFTKQGPEEFFATIGVREYAMTRWVS